MSNHQTLIIDRLWIGDRMSRKMIRWMKMSNIKLVCNMTPDLEFYGSHLITHKRFPMNDGMKGDANWKSMKKSSDEIHRVLQNPNGGSVLVHCHQGLSRSASAIGCYLIRYLGWSGDRAIEWIQTRRRGSLTYIGFRKMLWKWENESQTQEKSKGLV